MLERLCALMGEWGWGRVRDLCGGVPTAVVAALSFLPDDGMGGW